MRHYWKMALLLAGVLGATAAPAHAGLLPISNQVYTDGDNYRYAYGVVLTSDSKIEKGDFFTIYDFAGYIDGSATMPEGWTVSVSNTGGTPSGISPIDDPTKPNLTWTYTGDETKEGQIGLGNFTANSIYGTPETGSAFTARTHRQVDGQVDSNITETIRPTETNDPTPQTPEPTTLVLLGMALPVVGVARWYRRRSSETA